MSATGAPAGRELGQPTNGQSAAAIRHANAEHGRRLSTETKSAFRTTEFIAYVAVLAGVLIAGAITKATSHGNGHDPFRADRVWLYVTVLTVGYMISRGPPRPAAASPTTKRPDRSHRAWPRLRRGLRVAVPDAARVAAAPVLP